MEWTNQNHAISKITDSKSLTGFEKKLIYLVPERKLDSFSKFKEGEDFNHRNTLAYFED